MAPSFRVGPGAFGSQRFFPPPPPFGDPGQLPQFRMPSFGNAPTLNPAEVLGQTTIMPMLWYLQHHPLAFWSLQHLLPRERIATDGDRDRQADGGGSTVLPRELHDTGRRPVEPPPEPPGGHRPLGPFGGLLGLIAKYEQSISGNAGNASPASPDRRPAAPDAGRRGASDQPSADIRRLERIDTTAGKRKSGTYSPPLVPNMPPDDDPDLDAATAGSSDWGRNGPECDEERGKAYKTCVKARSVNRTFGGTTLDDCIRAATSPECGGTKIKWGLTPEEIARRNTERVRRIMRGEDPDDPDK